MNQVELHPYFPQAEMRAVHDRPRHPHRGVEPAGPRQAPFDEEPMAQAAERHGVTPAQVVLRWHVQLGAVPIPKSADADGSAPTSTSSNSS